MRTCPKCRKRISPFYFRIHCPGCGADLMYYRFDERLEADAEKAAAQEEELKRLLDRLPGRKKKQPDKKT